MTAPTGDLFRFLRYDVRLEPSWLGGKLGRNFSTELSAQSAPMDNPANMPMLYELGKSDAAEQVKRKDLMFAKVAELRGVLIKYALSHVRKVPKGYIR